jgi:hypothetical protein
MASCSCAWTLTPSRVRRACWKMCFDPPGSGGCARRSEADIPSPRAFLRSMAWLSEVLLREPPLGQARPVAASTFWRSRACSAVSTRLRPGRGLLICAKPDQASSIQATLHDAYRNSWPDIMIVDQSEGYSLAVSCSPRDQQVRWRRWRPRIKDGTTSLIGGSRAVVSYPTTSCRC